MPGEVRLNLPPRVIESARAAQYANRARLDARTTDNKIQARTVQQRQAEQRRAGLILPAGATTQAQAQRGRAVMDPPQPLETPRIWRRWRSASPAAFFVVYYSFETGRDLDQRTSLVLDNNIISPPIGWAAGSDYEGILWWGGDNTGTGVESFYVDCEKFSERFPSQDTIAIKLAAFWFNEVGERVTIKVEAYPDGTMRRKDYGFENVNDSGGVSNPLVYSNDYKARVFTQTQDSGYPGDFIAYVKLDPSDIDTLPDYRQTL